MTVRGYKMKMNYVDRAGRKTRPSHWVDVPNATRHANGFEQIERFVSRVLASGMASSWVQLSTKSGRTAISIAKHKSKLTLGLTVHAKRQRSREAAVRQFFASRHISPSADYLAANGGVPETTRVLDFPMPNSSTAVARVASDLLREIYRLRDTTTLDIRFEEHEAS
jgi:hypothetical protein